MSILVNIIIADEDDLEAIGESLHPAGEWSGLQVRDLDTARIATLHCLLVGVGFEEALSCYEPVYSTGEDGATVLRIPEELLERLAELDEETCETVGEELAATEEFELGGWPVEEVITLMQQLAELGQHAEHNGEAMYVWMHRLLT